MNQNSQVLSRVLSLWSPIMCLRATTRLSIQVWFKFYEFDSTLLIKIFFWFGLISSKEWFIKKKFFKSPLRNMLMMRFLIYFLLVPSFVVLIKNCSTGFIFCLCIDNVYDPLPPNALNVLISEMKIRCFNRQIWSMSWQEHL